MGLRDCEIEWSWAVLRAVAGVCPPCPVSVVVLWRGSNQTLIQGCQTVGVRGWQPPVEASEAARASFEGAPWAVLQIIELKMNGAVEMTAGSDTMDLA